MDNTGELKTGLDGSRFQQSLSDFIVHNKFKTIVETGYGVSSVFIVYALKHAFDMQDAKVYSVDPKPWFDKIISSEQHELIRAKSEEGLAELYMRTGPWDFFLHDGSHNTKAMDFDLEFGYSALRHGGVIACDDYTWNNGNVWQNFVQRNNLKELKMGDIAFAFKDSHKVLDKGNALQYAKWCLDFAKGRETAWLILGNKNSDAFED